MGLRCCAIDLRSAVGPMVLIALAFIVMTDRSAVAQVATASPITADPVAFDNPGASDPYTHVLVDPAVGDSYRYEDVRTGVDALVTVTAATSFPDAFGEAITVDWGDIDSVFSSNAFINARLPNTSTLAPESKSVTVRIDFQDADGDPVTLNGIAISAKDLDGNGASGEYVQYSGITKYCLRDLDGDDVLEASDNDIAVSTVGSAYRFAGTVSQTNSLAKDGWAEVYYATASSLEVTAGELLGNFARIAISFDEAGWSNDQACVDVARPTYELTYDANGATTGTVPDPTSGDGALTIADNTGSLALAPRTFAGWNSKEDGTGQSFPVGASYTPASDLTLFAQFPKVAQTITLPDVTTHPTTGAAPAIGDAPFAVTVSASSGLAVTLASTTPAVCTVAGTTVTLVALGDCTLTADQDGDTDYLAAAQATTTFTVGEPLPEPVPTPGASPVLTCSPPAVATGVEVTCTVTGGDPDVDVLWSAERDGRDLRRGVRLDAEGRAVFTFIAPDGSGPLDVRLVGWGAEVRLAVADAVVPTVVRAGGGPQNGLDERWGGVALALLLGVGAALRRRGRVTT